MKNTLKRITQVSLILFLTIGLFSCNKDDSPTISSTSDYYVTAKIQNDEHNIDFVNKGIGSAIALKAEVVTSEGSTVNISLHGKNDSFAFFITYESYTIVDGERNEGLQVFSITKNANTKDSYVWGEVDGTFTITKETEQYIEGTFSFIGEHINKETAEVDGTINITEGKFKVKKENF